MAKCKSESSVLRITVLTIAESLGTTKRRKSCKEIDTPSFNQKNKKFFVSLCSLLVQQKLESLKEKNLAFEY